MTRHDARLIAEELFKLQKFTEPYIDIKGAAEYLCMTVGAIKMNPGIPRYHIGRNVRFKKSDLDRWVMSQN